MLSVNLYSLFISDIIPIGGLITPKKKSLNISINKSILSTSQI